MPPDFKSAVGRASGEFRLAITGERIAAFCAALGIPDRGEAPPTFLTIAREGEFGMLDELGVPLSKLLHAEQEYSYGIPIRAGDELLYLTTLVQVLEKKGASGGMVFFILETKFQVLRGDQTLDVGMARTNLLTRTGAA